MLSQWGSKSHRNCTWKEQGPFLERDELGGLGHLPGG